MHDIRNEIDEIDKMLEDLNHKLSEESKLKIELDEYIAKEIETKSSNQIESIRSQCNELHVLLSKHKQHLWNHIQAIKSIKTNLFSQKENLTETNNSLNQVKTDLISEISKYYKELSNKDNSIEKILTDSISEAARLNMGINSNLETLNKHKEFLDAEIPKIHLTNEQQCKDIVHISESIFSTEGHLESRLQGLIKQIEDHKEITGSSLAKVETDLVSEISKQYKELADKDNSIEKILTDSISEAARLNLGINSNLETLNKNKEFLDAEIPKIHLINEQQCKDIVHISESIFSADGHLESRLNEVLEYTVDNDQYLIFVDKIENDLRLKNQAIKNLRFFAIAHSIVVVFTIAFFIIRVLL